MNILVTGGAGFIGTNLVLSLAGGENRVTVIDNLHTGSEENLKEVRDRVEFIREMPRTPPLLKHGFDLIFHLGFYSASPMYRNNPMLVGEVVNGMIGILELARRVQCPVVFSSTSSIYNGIKPPHREDAQPLVTDFYTEARIAAERISQLYNQLYDLNVAAMRFFSVYGKYERAKNGYANLATQFLWDMKAGRQPVIYGNGKQRRDFVYAGDVVEALVRATKVKGFRVYNVGYGKNYSLNELVAKLNSLLGTEIEPKYVPMPIKNYVMETLADTSRAESEIGFRARVGLDEGLRIINDFYGRV
ncbi:NAD-dependent epimerase/dehydratase family protein [Thermogymnomonas acidicola]|uniref:NAD-dependent epimerase/dehydratase family protein n=1 Tax=Thermogymnomonas acidicola TaxID=399579 RepID=UPI0009464BEC|nr:NAD-dependent epimerase/dehydratase family protein [Thermogymnomonas acidicola]